MKKSRLTDQQIAFALKQVETGTPIEDVCRKLGISQQTFCRWKRKFAGLGTEELRRLNQLEEQNKRLYAVGVTLAFSRPAKPTDNAFIESFSGSVRAECLNENWFLSLDDVAEKIEAWRVDDNEDLAIWATWPPNISLHLAGSPGQMKPGFSRNDWCRFGEQGKSQITKRSL